ncbi:hypothetical protein BKA82DRAFT_130893 [Pisolithus tinctorius]|uniref:Uncharacterized protein n=1 Tax=Pisolithus tinctorius Marx 270 TaxID=870435 RepID=A0A0C3PNP9_PISTI|nr:hypothetical protein BKA82DRAFT_130893 [Pisolithus tinctorius]KIO10039.1 hypothetical protein M404DRAFT_130893 [Pisolithus tinctorius Marx 270]
MLPQNSSLPIDVHTPRSSFSVIHSLNGGSLQQLCDKLTRKGRVEFRNKRVGPGWIKYFWNNTVWNLDDADDYTIFVRRHNPTPASNEGNVVTQTTLHVNDPSSQLPGPPEYQNPSFYVFQSSRTTSPLPRSDHSVKGNSEQHTNHKTVNTGVAKHRKDFEKFHNENGVRTVVGSIGPVTNVRMLLRKGYRHVYMSRKFALKHGFIPADAAPGHYGYGGLVNLGKWPITLTVADRPPLHGVGSAEPSAPTTESPLRLQSKTVSVPVYLSEEPHFDVVLGRSFFECRQIKLSTVDPTEVICLDTGEKVECQLVVLKDGRGEVVIVT